MGKRALRAPPECKFGFASPLCLARRWSYLRLNHRNSAVSERYYRLPPFRALRDWCEFFRRPTAGAEKSQVDARERILIGARRAGLAAELQFFSGGPVELEAAVLLPEVSPSSREAVSIPTAPVPRPRARRDILLASWAQLIAPLRDVRLPAAHSNRRA